MLIRGYFFEFLLRPKGRLGAPYEVKGHLTLARTSYFAFIERTWGGEGVPPPPARLPQIEIELRNKDKKKDRDVLNLNIPNFTTSGHILTFPGQVKDKMSRTKTILVHVLA